MPVEANDYPGFIANRILMPMINEAFYALMEGVGTREAIDTVMKLGMNHPMGPLTLADFIGLDVCLAILEVLHHGLGDPKYRPCPLLRRMVDAGHLGRKSGQGVYTYATEPRTEVSQVYVSVRRSASRSPCLRWLTYVTSNCRAAIGPGSAPLSAAALRFPHTNCSGSQ